MKLNDLLKFGTLTLGAAVSLTAMAQEGKPGVADQVAKPAGAIHDKITGQNYGTAGCGLGSVVFADKPGMIQIVAATLNGISANQTFGITSGTLNCAGSNDMAQQTQQFIENNQEVLKSEVAQGQGESVNTLASLLQCSDAEALGMGLQKNFENIFPGASAAEVHSRIQRSIQADEALSLACGSDV